VKEQFASDNGAGICPAALRWLIEANGSGHEPGYGDDRWTQRASDMIRALFQTDCDVYFVFNGTAANSLALASLCQSYHSVICTPVAHVETDECGGPEFFSNGSKLLVTEADSAAGRLGKLTPDAIEQLVTKRSDIHYPKPKVVSITQATELGTVYSVEELRAIAAIAKRRHLRLHMDGARFANAVAYLGCHPSEITWRAGIDVLCFTGHKSLMGPSGIGGMYVREGVDVAPLKYGGTGVQSEHPERSIVIVDTDNEEASRQALAEALHVSEDAGW